LAACARFCGCLAFEAEFAAGHIAGDGIVEMKPSIVVILALAAPILPGCAGFGGEGAPAAAPRPPAALASTEAAQPMAPVAAVQAQPLPPASAASTASIPPSPAAPATSPPAASVPSGAALGGVLGGPVGASLTQADRQAAWSAQIAALDSGQNRSWRGGHGVFGFVAPGADIGGGCRGYSQTIYIAGRPNRGQGVACRQADGTWQITR
jgi:surface antigen